MHVGSYVGCAPYDPFPPRLRCEACGYALRTISVYLWLSPLGCLALIIPRPL